MGREPENPFSQKHCKCRRGSALGAHVLPTLSHPASVRNVLGTSINKSSQSRELSSRPWVSSAIRHRVFLTRQSCSYLVPRDRTNTNHEHDPRIPWPPVN